MSTYANPAKAFLPLDGDAFRAAAGTAIPADIFATSLVGWDAYGGIKAGFSVETAQENTKLTIFNKVGTYRNKKGQEEPTLKFRPVDQSKATALTNLRGGAIAAGNGGFKWTTGSDENFALIIRVQDGGEWIAYYCQKATLNTIPTETLDGEDLVGYDYEVVPLVPNDGSDDMIRFSKTNPLA